MQLNPEMDIKDIQAQLASVGTYRLAFFGTYDDLKKIDLHYQTKGFNIVSVNFSQPTSNEGLALWRLNHENYFGTSSDSDVLLSWQVHERGSFRRFLKVSDKSSFTEDQVIYQTSDGFEKFNIAFARLKKTHTIVGIWIEQSAKDRDRLLVHSCWIENMKVGFYCYFNMSVSKFSERLNDLALNGGYKLQDVSIYTNQWGKVQIAAVWLAQTPKYRVEPPLGYKMDDMTAYVYDKLMIPYNIPSVQLLLAKNGEIVID